MDSDESFDWSLIDDGDGESSGLSVPVDSLPIFEDDLGYENDATATPMIQVFCVVVDTVFDDNMPCEIYGSIRAVEGQHSFHLYDRDPEDSETITKHGTLSLIGPEDRVMLPFTGVTLDVCLRDNTRRVEVVKGTLSFDSLIEGEGEGGGGGDCFDKLMKVTIQGEHGSAHVYYAIFQFSIWCTLKVAITDLKGNSSGPFSDIYGSLTASYGNSRRYCCTDDEVKYLESTLFKKPYDKPMRIMVGNPIELSRYVVVMPAYSSLKVEANLWDSTGEIVNGTVEFQAKSRGEDRMFIKSPHASLQVQVRWYEAYLQLYNYRVLSAETKVVEDIKQDDVTQKKRRVIPGQPLRSSSSSIGPTRARPYYSGFYLTEIFSICVGGITEETIHALCGTIIVQNGLRKFHIYNKDKSCFDLLEDDNIVCTEGPDHVIGNCEFDMFINLRDPVRDLEVSRGSLGWCCGQLGKNNMSWLDKRLCSVIRGENGFAAIHYMIFNNALRAHVEVRFFSSNSLADVPASVYGHLIAYYDGCDYSKSYERKYYRSRLFEVPQSKSVELMTESNLTLSRSVVAVPTVCSLLIEADLKVCGLSGVCNSKEGYVSGTIEFEIDRSSCTRKEIKGDNCWIELSVKFQ